MNLFFKCALCFVFLSKISAEESSFPQSIVSLAFIFHPLKALSTPVTAFLSIPPECVRGEIVEAFDQKQERNGYLFLNRLVLGPGSFHGYVLHYYGFKTLTQDEARTLIVTNIEDMLSQLNSLEKQVIETHYRFPLMPEDIKMAYINFESKDVHSQSPYVGTVSNHHDVIDYYFYSDSSINNEKIVSESYNEAYEKVYGKPRQPLCEPRKPPTNSGANPQ